MEQHTSMCSNTEGFIIEKSNKKIFDCLKCDKKFAMYRDFKKHERTHKVDNNDKGYDSENHLTTHEAIHTTKKHAFTCAKCNKTFKNIRHKNKHNCTLPKTLKVASLNVNCAGFGDKLPDKREYIIQTIEEHEFDIILYAAGLCTWAV